MAKNTRINGKRIKKVFASGDINDAMIYCGQVAGLINEIPSVKEIIDGIVSEAKQVWQRLNGMDFPA